MNGAESAGFFSPSSVAWRVLSDPSTALMIAQITNLLEVPHRDFQAVLMGHDPLFPTNQRRQRGAGAKSGSFHDRLRRTVSVPFPIIFGDRATAIACARRLFDYHRPMNGVVAPTGERYSATDPDAMLFAATTISHAALIAYENYSVSDALLPRRLADPERDRYFRDMAELAVLMGVPRDRVPVTSAQVARYYRSLSDRMSFLPGWTAAQRKTGLTLARPAGLSDLKSTLVDLLLMASAVWGYAALPAPARRLHRIPTVLDPVLALVRRSALPVFWLLRIDRVRSFALSRYLGDEAAATLADANRRAGVPTRTPTATRGEPSVR